MKHYFKNTNFMKQGIIKYSQEFISPIGLKRWVGIEYPVDFDTDNPHEVLDKLQGMTESWYNKKELQSPTTEIKSDRQPEDIRVAALIADIYGCKELSAKKEGLESYKKMVDSLSDKYPEVKSVYNQKYNQLKNKKVINLP